MNLIIYNTKNNIKNSLILNIIILLLLISLFLITKNIYEKYILFTKTSKETLIDNKENEYIFLIKEKNKKENIFLFDTKEPDNDTLTKIENIYKNYNKKIVQEYVFPIDIITRTSSYSLIAYGIEENKYKELSENIIYGEMFNKGENEIVVGSFLASNMNLNTNEYVSFLRRNERGWLDNKVFLVKGIFSVDKYNDNIFSDEISASNFIFSKEGKRSAYNKNIYIIFNEKVNTKKIVSIFNKSILKENYEIEYTKTDYEEERDLSLTKTIIKTLFVIFIISVSLLIVSLNNLQIAKRLSHGFVGENKPLSKRSTALQLFFITFLSILISYIIVITENGKTLKDNYLLYPSLSVVLSSTVAVIITIVRKHTKETL